MSLVTNHLAAHAKMLTAAASAVGSFVLCAVIFAGLGNAHAATPLDDNSIAPLTALDHAMEAVAARVTPAVVNVAVTSRSSKEFSSGSIQGLPPGLQQFFGPMFQQPAQPQIEHGVGSGVIISQDGYIVTNDHVVDGATQIRVTLNNRRTLDAKVIGVDKLTDLAVLKVNATDLPAIVWGDSTKLEPGQTVLAFGSPFGYFQFSVTRGIVSAVNRPNPYSDDARKPGGYIQTDAAINPGNSGGPLVNAHGELVGINTFIISNSGSFAGAGFAIPSQIAHAITEQIIKNGKVEHGYLGIAMNDVTPDNAHFFDLPDATGAIVSQITPDSPASRGGLKTGDVIAQLNGQKIVNGSALQVAVTEMAPGSKIALGVIRDGKPVTLNLTVGQFHGNSEAAANGGDDEEPSGKIGFEVGDLTPEARQQFDVPDHVHGVVVQSVRPASPADEAGIQPGDVILEVDRKPTETVSQFADELRQNKDGKDVLMLVWSKGNASYRTIHCDQSNHND